ncbi:MAG: thiamine biosynthesis protein ThiF [Campylobacterota bacterium]|nr:thiamine biosynthesis protein ThiF [Campylobacterota bacterium]
MDGFNLESDLVCEGIVGDGCGGGRVFFVENDYLYAYDPMTKAKLLLLEELVSAKYISKSGCIITIKCERDTINFDLKALKN